MVAQRQNDLKVDKIAPSVLRRKVDVISINDLWFEQVDEYRGTATWQDKRTDKRTDLSVLDWLTGHGRPRAGKLF
jgi:hypothetical protein